MRDKSGIRVAVALVLIFLCLHFSNTATAQQPYIPFKHYSTVQGLSQNHVITILQDRQGFMWFGTLEGLNKFDGYDFSIFLHDSKDSTSLIQNFASCIIEDRDGVIWVGTGGGLSRFNRATNTFTSYAHDPTDSNSISGGLINEILEDKHGNFWIALTTGYLDYFDRKQNKFIHYQLHKNLTDITSLIIDSDGNLWIGSRAGIAVMDESHKTIKQFRHEPYHKTSLSSSVVYDIFQDAKGVIWVATDEGLNQYDRDNQNFSRRPPGDNGVNTIKAKVIKCITQDREGRLWLGTENGGLDIWDPSNNDFYHYEQNDSDLQGISDNSIYSIYEDLSGNIWIGTNKSGVDFYDRLRKPFVVYQHIYEEKTSLSHNKINAIAEQPGQGFWVATDGGGLNFFNEEKGIFKAYQYNDNDPQSIPSNFLVDVLWDKMDQCLWIATWGGGLARMDIRSGKFKRFQHDADDPSSIASNNLWRILQDKKGTLYIGTVGNGLSIYDKTSSKFINYGPQHGLAEENVVSIYIDRKNFLWLGGWGNGLSRMDLSTRKFVPLPDGINSKSNESIFADSLNRIWVSGNEGIQCYNPEDDSTFSLTTADGLPETSVNGMTTDDHGNFWLATNKGIVQYNLAKRKSNIFGIEDGLPANQFVPRLLKTSNGKMYFGSINGLVVFHPDSIKQNPIAPVVLLTDLKIFNKSVFAGGEHKILDKPISETKEIWLPAKYNFITLSFVALNYTSPQGNEYAYKLQRFDKDWIRAAQQRSATYTNLDPGDYIFTVKASNNDGLWNEQGTSLIIHVLPAWWATVWFRALLTVFVVGSAILFYRYRIRRIANQNKKLSALVEERTSELTELNAAVIRQNEMLQERQEEIQSQNEELKQSQEEVMTQRDVVWAQNQKLEDARKIIEKQNEEIKLRNENLELEVQSRTKELVEYNQQLEQFAFISAHNLRAPVARLLGLGHILDLESRGNNHEASGVAQKMVSTAKELDRVVRDLNTILEIRKNNHSFISDVNLDDELSRVKHYIEKEIEDTKCIIKADFSIAPKIRSVKPYVESVLQNLLSNAIKYRHPDRVPVITLSTLPVDDYVCLTVSDNGLGIDTALYKDKVFTLYQRFHTHVEGKGLGLYLVKTQIQALGGKIELESNVGQGTVFKVYFKKAGRVVMLDLVIEARKASLAPGMDVRRILPFRMRRMVGPFIFMDHAGPVTVQPQQAKSMDVLPHPHIGLSTVSYLFGGQVTHRDSLGVEQVIRPGEVNWMTAGKGIAHSERFEDPSALAGGNLEMIQTWVALPEKDEESIPSFNNYKPDVLPIFTDTGVWMRLIAGNAFGLKSSVKTHSPLFYLHVILDKGTRFGLPKEHSERAIYVVKGSVEVAEKSYAVGQMLVFNKCADPTIIANEPTTLMLLGGEPLGERFIWWNFVSSRRERIDQAKSDWKEGRIILPPSDNHEFVPLPEDKSKPAGPPPELLS